MLHLDDIRVLYPLKTLKLVVNKTVLFIGEAVLSDKFYGIGLESFFFMALVDLGVLPKPDLLSKVVLSLEVKVEGLLSQELDPILQRLIVTKEELVRMVAFTLVVFDFEAMVTACLCCNCVQEFYFGSGEINQVFWHYTILILVNVKCVISDKGIP